MQTGQSHNSAARAALPRHICLTFPERVEWVSLKAHVLKCLYYEGSDRMRRQFRRWHVRGMVNGGGGGGGGGCGGSGGGGGGGRDGTGRDG